MFSRLLVPLDGSDLAEGALPAAIELARKFDSEIVLLSIIQDPFVPSYGRGQSYYEVEMQLRERAYEESRQYLEARRDELAGAGLKVSISLIKRSDVAATILDTAVDIGADAIIMSTHGRGGLTRWVYGSVADKVLQHAPVPVLLQRIAAA